MSCPACQRSIRTTKPRSGRGYSLPPARRELSSTRYNTGSGEPYITSLDEFKVRIHQDFERYGQIVKAAGVQVH